MILRTTLSPSSHTKKAAKKKTHPNVNIVGHILFPLLLRLHAISRVDLAGFEYLQHRFRLEEAAGVRRRLGKDPSVPLGFKDIGVDKRMVVDRR